MNSFDISVIKKIIIRVFQSLIVAFLLSLIYFFYQPEAIFFSITIKNPFFEYVQLHEWWLYLVIYLTIISIIHILILGYLSFYFTLKRSTIEKQFKHYEFLFTEYLVDYFFSPKMTDDTKSELMLKIKRNTKKKVQILSLFTIYTRLQDITADDLSQKFTVLLNTMKLRKKLENLLYSYNFSNKILAFRVISYLKILKYNDFILKYTQSTNYALRTEAITTLIRLSKDDNLSFLIDHSHHLTILDVNVIVNVVIDTTKFEVDYIKLMKSKMTNKILIAVLIAKQRRKVEIKDEIRALIGHPDEILNWELWDTYLQLEDDHEKCIDLIINKFNSESEKIKILILSREIKTDNQRYYDFINEVIKKDDSVIVITKAMNQLFNYNFDHISEFINSDDKFISMAYKDVIDFYT